MIMPYGKFKSKDMGEIPSAYLKWLAENMDESKETEREICYAADIEYNWRPRNDSHF